MRRSTRLPRRASAVPRARPAAWPSPRAPFVPDLRDDDRGRLGRRAARFGSLGFGSLGLESLGAVIEHARTVSEQTMRTVFERDMRGPIGPRIRIELGRELHYGCSRGWAAGSDHERARVQNWKRPRLDCSPGAFSIFDKVQPSARAKDCERALMLRVRNAISSGWGTASLEADSLRDAQARLRGHVLHVARLERLERADVRVGREHVLDALRAAAARAQALGQVVERARVDEAERRACRRGAASAPWRRRGGALGGGEVLEAEEAGRDVVGAGRGDARSPSGQRKRRRRGRARLATNAATSPRALDDVEASSAGARAPCARSGCRCTGARRASGRAFARGCSSAPSGTKRSSIARSARVSHARGLLWRRPFSTRARW